MVLFRLREKNKTKVQEKKPAKTIQTGEIKLDDLYLEALIEKPSVSIMPKRIEPDLEKVEFISRKFDRELKMVPESEGASPIEVDLRSNTVKVFPQHDTVPGDQAGQKQFFRVMLAVELFEKLGPVSNDEPGLVGWLRRI